MDDRRVVGHRAGHAELGAGFVHRQAVMGGVEQVVRARECLHEALSGRSVSRKSWSRLTSYSTKPCRNESWK